MMKRYALLPGGLLSLALIGSMAHSQSAADNGWIGDILDDRCTEESADLISGAVRDNIESHVARAEAAIEPPMPVGDLSCLTGLMEAPLDSFSNIGGILGDLQGGITGSLSGVDGITGINGETISRQVCDFASEKWAEVSEPLDFDIATSTIPDLSSSFDLFNNPGVPGNVASAFGEVLENGSVNGSQGTVGTSPVINQITGGSLGTSGSFNDIMNSIGK